MKNIIYSSNDCELKSTKHIFVNYLYENPIRIYRNSTREGCLSDCVQDSSCSAVVLGSDCLWYRNSESLSYAVAMKIGENETVFIKICKAGLS